MAGILSVLVILGLSVLITRIATVALTHTGLSREAAAFQSRSAFTGVGFMTSEAESAVNHPVRRRVVALLMLLGNVGIVTAMSSLIVGFVAVADDEASRLARLMLLAGGVSVLVVLARNKFVDRWLSRAISWALERWTDLEARDYEELLRLSGDYRVRELRVESDDWMADSSLSEMGLRAEGIEILGIQRPGGEYIGAPQGETCVHAGDILLVYGRRDAIRELDSRRKGPAGDSAHRNAVAEQSAIRDRESRRDANRSHTSRRSAHDDHSTSQREHGV